MILFIPLKGSWAQNIFSMFAFIKKIKIEYNFNLSFVNFRKKMTTEHRLSFLIIHFSLFQFRKTMNIKFNLISLPHPPPPKKKKWKMNMQFHYSFSTFRKKGMNRMQVRWSALNNDHLFHSQSLTSFSIAAPVTSTQRLLTPNRWNRLHRWKRPGPPLQ